MEGQTALDEAGIAVYWCWRHENCRRLFRRIGHIRDPEMD